MFEAMAFRMCCNSLLSVYQAYLGMSTEFLQQLPIVSLWYVVDRFSNVLWIPIKIACKQAVLKQYSVVVLM